MAKKKLEGIIWPNLPNDTYILDAEKVEYDDTETYSEGSVGDALQNKANIDGSYENLTAGNAEQIVTDIRANDQTPYLFRTSGGSVDIGDREYINGIVGGTVAFNQQAGIASSSKTTTINGITCTDNRDGSYTFSGTASAFTSINLVGEKSWSPNHKYIFWGCPPNGSASTYQLRMRGAGGDTADDGNGALWNPGTTIWKGISVVIQEGITLNNLVFKPQILDLTQMFGSTIADYIYSLEQSQAGAGVAFFKTLFPKPYYAYNAGELMSVNASSHNTVGFNQWDGTNSEEGKYLGSTGGLTTNSMWNITDYIRVLPNITYHFENLNSGPSGACLCWYDANKDFISSRTIDKSLNETSPANACYVRATYLATSKNTVCINLSWDGERDGEYEEYVKHSYPLDSDLELRGIPKLDASNNLYYDGDVYEADGTVTRKYGIVDLGTLGWSKYNTSSDATGEQYIYGTTGLNGLNKATAPAEITCITNKYTGVLNVTSNTEAWKRGNMTCSMLIGNGDRRFYVRDDSLIDKTPAEFKTAMSGIYLIYELATPTTETADPYTNPQIVDDFGTEEYVTTSIVPVGHKTQYMPNLRAKLEMAPNSPNGNGDYIVRQTNGMNEYVPLVIEDTLPTIPSTAGSYKLTVTVTEGSDPVLSWEAE